MAFLELIKVLRLWGQETEKVSNSSLESPVLSWGRTQHRDSHSAHAAALSTGHEALVCAVLNFVQSVSRVPESVPKRCYSCWSDSFSPARPQPPD